MKPQTFLAKIKYTKQLTDGTFKRVTDPVIFEGFTYSHVEERIFTEFAHVQGDIFIDDIKRVKFDDVFFGFVPEDEEALFAIAKVNFETFDMETEKKKSITNKYLLRGTEWKQFETDLAEILKNVDFQHAGIKVQNITQTNYVDYIILSDEERANLEESEKEDTTAPIEFSLSQSEIGKTHYSVSLSSSDTDEDDDQENAEDSDEDENED